MLVVVVDAFHGRWSLFGSGCGHRVLLASLLGGRGVCWAVVDILQQAGSFDVVGLV